MGVGGAGFQLKLALNNWALIFYYIYLKVGVKGGQNYIGVFS